MVGERCGAMEGRKMDVIIKSIFPPEFHYGTLQNQVDGPRNETFRLHQVDYYKNHG